MKTLRKSGQINLKKKNTEKSQNGFVQKDQKLNRASKQEICKKYRTKISAIKAHSSQDYVFLNLEVLFQLSQFPFTTPVSPKKKKSKYITFQKDCFVSNHSNCSSFLRS